MAMVTVAASVICAGMGLRTREYIVITNRISLDINLNLYANNVPAIDGILWAFVSPFLPALYALC